MFENTNREGYLKLGEILLKDGVITASQLEDAINAQKLEGGRLGEVLVKLGMAKEEQIAAALDKQLKLPYFSSGTLRLKPAPGMV